MDIYLTIGWLNPPFEQLGPAKKLYLPGERNSNGIKDITVEP